MSNVPIKTIGKWLTILPDPPALKTASGIIVEDEAIQSKYTPDGGGVKNRLVLGTITSISDGYRDEITGDRIPMDLKPGDRVIFNRLGKMTVDINGQIVVLIKYEDIQIVVEDE